MVYLRKIFALTLFSVIIEALSPEGSGCKKHLKRITSLLLLLAIMSPLSGFLEVITRLPSIKDIGAETGGEQDREEFDMILISEAKLAIEKNVRELLTARYSIPLEAIEVRCELDASDISSVKLKQIDITLAAIALPLNLDAISEYISSALGCQCRVKQK